MSRSTLSWHFCCVAIEENIKFRIHINLIFCFDVCSLIIYAHTFIRGKIVWYSWETCWKCVYIDKYYATGTPKTFLYLDFWRRRGNFTRNNDVRITHVSLGIIWINHRYHASHGSFTNKAFYIAMQRLCLTTNDFSQSVQLLHFKQISDFTLKITFQIKGKIFTNIFSQIH